MGLGVGVDSNPKLVRHLFCLILDTMDIFLKKLFSLKKMCLTGVQENIGGKGLGDFDNF